MRHWPLCLTGLLLLAACTTPPAAPPAANAPARQQATSPEGPDAAAPSAAPTETPTPEPTATPTPTPTPTPSPTPSASPSQLRDVPEADHGATPFPAAPGGAQAYDLSSALVSAGAGNVTAYGAIDGKPYTEWSARQGVGPGTTLTIDLGASRPLGRLDLLPDASPDASKAAPKVFFNVDLSIDAKTWHTVGAGTGTGSKTQPTWASATWSPESARYVRLTPTSWGQSWVAVWELRLYATNASPSP